MIPVVPNKSMRSKLTVKCAIAAVLLLNPATFSEERAMVKINLGMELFTFNKRQCPIKEVKPFLPGTLEGNRFLAMDLMENRSEESAIVFFPYLTAASFGG